MAILMKISQDRVRLVAGGMFGVGAFLVPGVSCSTIEIIKKKIEIYNQCV